MMLKELREKVYEANMDLPKHGLVVFTWAMPPSSIARAVCS